jgi:hypothetical protein
MEPIEGYEYSNWRDNDWEREAREHLADLAEEEELQFDE